VISRALLKNIVNESVTYRLPTSKNVLFFDFYTLAFLNTLILDPTAKGSRAAFTQRDNVTHDIEYAENLLVPHLRKELMDATFLSICAEIRHLYDNTQDEKKMQQIVQSSVFRKYTRKYAELRSFSGLGAGAQQYSNGGKQGAVANDIHPRRIRTKFEGSHNAYTVSMKAALWAIKKSGQSAREFVTLCRYAFDNLRWSSSYGGRAWANICEGWLMLQDSQSDNIRRAIVNIDHVFDMQHNTGTVLNKVKEYAVNGGYGWLSAGLDFKAHATSPYLLVDKCSSDMRKLARMALKAAGYRDERMDAALADAEKMTSKTAPVDNVEWLEKWMKKSGQQFSNKHGVTLKKTVSDDAITGLVITGPAAAVNDAYSAFGAAVEYAKGTEGSPSWVGHSIDLDGKTWMIELAASHSKWTNWQAANIAANHGCTFTEKAGEMWQGNAVYYEFTGSKGAVESVIHAYAQGDHGKEMVVRKHMRPVDDNEIMSVECNAGAGSHEWADKHAETWLSAQGMNDVKATGTSSAVVFTGPKHKLEKIVKKFYSGYDTNTPGGSKPYVDASMQTMKPVLSDDDQGAVTLRSSGDLAYWTIHHGPNFEKKFGVKLTLKNDHAVVVAGPVGSIKKAIQDFYGSDAVMVSHLTKSIKKLPPLPKLPAAQSGDQQHSLTLSGGPPKGYDTMAKFAAHHGCTVDPAPNIVDGVPIWTVRGSAKSMSKLALSYCEGRGIAPESAAAHANNLLHHAKPPITPEMSGLTKPDKPAEKSDGAVYTGITKSHLSLTDAKGIAETYMCEINTVYASTGFTVYRITGHKAQASAVLSKLGNSTEYLNNFHQVTFASYKLKMYCSPHADTTDIEGYAQHRGVKVVIADQDQNTKQHFCEFTGGLEQLHDVIINLTTVHDPTTTAFKDIAQGGIAPLKSSKSAAKSGSDAAKLVIKGFKVAHSKEYAEYHIIPWADDLGVEFKINNRNKAGIGGGNYADLTGTKEALEAFLKGYFGTSFSTPETNYWLAQASPVQAPAQAAPEAPQPKEALHKLTLHLPGYGIEHAINWSAHFDCKAEDLGDGSIRFTGNTEGMKKLIQAHLANRPQKVPELYAKAEPPIPSSDYLGDGPLGQYSYSTRDDKYAYVDVNCTQGVANSVCGKYNCHVHVGSTIRIYGTPYQIELLVGAYSDMLSGTLSAQGDPSKLKIEYTEASEVIVDFFNGDGTIAYVGNKNGCAVYHVGNKKYRVVGPKGLVHTALNELFDEPTAAKLAKEVVPAGSTPTASANKKSTSSASSDGPKSPWMRYFGDSFEVPDQLWTHPQVKDSSSTPDPCPSFMLKNNFAVIMWVAHPDKEKRDTFTDRFTVTDGGHKPAYAGEDFEAAFSAFLSYLPKKRKKAEPEQKPEEPKFDPPFDPPPGTVENDGPSDEGEKPDPTGGKPPA